MGNIFLVLGIVSLLVSGFAINAWGSGERQRVHFDAESTEDRKKRTKVALWAFLIGFVCFALSMAFYML